MRLTRWMAEWAVLMIACVGSPKAAESVGESLKLSIQPSQAGPAISIVGGTGPVRIEYSPSLSRSTNWSLLTTVQALASPFLYTDGTASGVPRRFYRATSERDLPAASPTPVMVWIDPGSFTMGSPGTEKDRDADEGPLTQVTISRGFGLGKYEITQAAYLSVMEVNPSEFTGDLQRPVEMLSWEEATNFCARLTASERAAGRLPPGYTYCLPTEAQWEYACRAGTITATPWGSSLSSTQANFNGSWPYGAVALGPFLNRTARVGSYPPNAWGLYDMPGNVSEWCLDRASNSLPGGTVTDPVGTDSNSCCLMYRGGSWADYGWQCRSSFRYRTGSRTRINRLGFRVALIPGQPDSATAPLILRPPFSQTVSSAATVVFSVEARGAPLFYQWRFNGADIPGATESSHRLGPVQITDGGSYSVVVKNSAGAVASQAAVLTVDPPQNPDPANLIWLNPGTFTLGSPGSESDRDTMEGPPTQVTLSQGFWISKYETTQEEYLAIMGHNPSSFTGNGRRPVEMVRWEYATNYCARLTDRERAAGHLPIGYEYRLPTEAEWEYAARAGTTTATAYGDVLASTQANFNGNFPYAGANSGPYLQITTPVGSYAPNAWGLYDMHGNAREWCLDWLGPYPGGHVTDPRGPTNDPFRAIRGGDWISRGREARSAARYFAYPGEVVNGGYGFRVVVALGTWNGGFEQPTLSGWRSTGDFSTWQPVSNDLFTVKRIASLRQQIASSIGGDYWRELTYPIGHQGEKWLTTACRQKGPPGQEDDAFSERFTGTFISQNFQITRKFITFLLGGDQDDASLRVELLLQTAPGANTVEVDGQHYRVVNHTTGHGEEWLRRAHWDVSGYALKNQTARIRIVDNSTTGHLNVDDFRFKDTSPADDSLVVGNKSYSATRTFEGFTIDADSPVWGFADLHTHPMSYLGFGGQIMHGQPDGGAADPANMALGLNDCKADHGGWGIDNPQGNYWRQIMMFALDDAGPDPHREGWASQPLVQFRNWPVFTTIAHQQMWYEWIKRARDGGLRVMVALCVNNRLLGTVSKGLRPVDDQSVGDAQITELKNFVGRHTDFLEIAYDPFELRDIVRRGKLAIVIGSELDDIGNLVRNSGVKAAADDFSKLLVSNEIHRLHTNGVRYIFPVHLVNNKFGGTAIAGVMLNLANKYLNGEGFQVQPAAFNDNLHYWLDNIDFRTFVGLNQVSPELASVILGAGSTLGAPLVPALLPLVAAAVSVITPALPGSSAAFTGLVPLALAGAASVLPPLLTMVGIDQGEVLQTIIPLPGNYPIYPTPQEAPNGVRNALGLTPLGQYAITEMMNLGMMLDVDHMSQESINGLDGVVSLATNRPGGYPLNSGHNGFREAGLHERAENSRSRAQMVQLRALGGLMGVGWENSKDGSFARSASEVSNPDIGSSQVPNDCAGTSKTFAQGYLLALERLGGANVAIGTDIDGFVVSPGPRFGPQAAFGLGTEEAGQRKAQIEAQRNGVLYEPRHASALTTPAFRGRAVQPKKLTGEVTASAGYAYTVDQADFFAALNVFFSLQSGVQSGGLTEPTAVAAINSIVNAYSENYAGQYPEGDLSGGSRAHIANYALGLLAGIKDWPIGSDLTPDKTASIKIGQAVYRTRNLASTPPPPPDIIAQPDYLLRYYHQLKVWDDYQRTFGTNTPLRRCQSGSKQWDINFEGVAHYGLLPDFLQDLSNVGINSQDLSVLFRSAENFARMWTRCLNAAVPAR